MKCWQCGNENLPEAIRCSVCGADLAPVAAAVVEEGDGTGGLIPYKNPKALLAYYLGILSGLPIIGLPVGIAAFILGWQGLRARKENPVIKGSVHAGIGCGCFFSLLWTALIIVVAIAIVSDR